MASIYGQHHTLEYLNMVQSMSNLLKMNHKYRVTHVLLDQEEKFVSFQFEKVS